MHSSRMRTSHSLTVCWCLLPGEEGGVWSRGCLLWGVSAPGGVSAPRGVSALGGGSGPRRGVCPRGGLLPGRGGVCSWGGLVWGRRGLLRGGGAVSQHALRQTPPLWTESQTPVKTLPWPNFVAAGNNKQHLSQIP